MKNTVSIMLRFMEEYRAFEDDSINNNRKKITAAMKQHEHVIDHTISSWEGRKRDFGDFFLNLDHTAQGDFIQLFGIPVPELENYRTLIQEKPTAALFAEPPYEVALLHELLKFYYNHGIMDDTIEGISLKRLPEDPGCYGNSTNWANYILTLPAELQEEVLEALEPICIANRKR